MNRRSALGSTARPGRRAGRRVRPVPAALLLLTLLTACSQAGGEDRPAGDGGLPRVGTELPLNAYERIVLDAGVKAQKAIPRLIERCMARRGYHYGDYPSLDIVPGWRDSPYRVIPSAHAAAYGYHQAPSGSKHKGFHLTYDGKESARDRAVEGCEKETQRTLRAGLSRESDAKRFNARADGLAGKADTDARVVHAVTRWSACMKSRGYDFAKPNDPVKKFTGVVGGTYVAKATAREKATAAADAACNRKVSLERVWLSVMVPLQRDLIDGHRAEYRKALAWFEGYRRNAEKAVQAA